MFITKNTIVPTEHCTDPMIMIISVFRDSDKVNIMKLTGDNSSQKFMINRVLLINC